MQTTYSSTLSDYADNLAYRSPNEIISTFNDEINVFTIKELNEKAGQLAKGLICNGVARNTRVAVVLSKTTSCMTFMLALAKAGAVVVPLRSDWDQKTIEKILKEENIHTLGFYADSFIKPFRRMIPDYTNNERGYLNNTRFPTLKNIVTFGSIKNRGMFTTRELMLVGSHIDDIEMESAMHSSKPDDTFLEIITYEEKTKTIQKITHKELLKLQLTFPELLVHLLEIIE